MPERRKNNTWALAGLPSPAPASLACTAFRAALVYFDHEGVGRMDAWPHGPVDADAPLVRVGAVRLGTHSLDIDRRYCSCKSYKYRQNKEHDRNCKHLNSICTPARLVTYTKKPQAFQLISETVPRDPAVYHQEGWVYSEKHDGIRVRVDGTVGWTRNGMRIDLSGIWTPPPGRQYDAELCTREDTTSTHSTVLARVLSGKVLSLRLRVFDIIDPDRTFGDRLALLRTLEIPPPNQVAYTPVRPCLRTALDAMPIGTPGCEGVIVRNTACLYDGSGKRSNRSVFKVKAANLDAVPRQPDGLDGVDFVGLAISTPGTCP